MPQRRHDKQSQTKLGEFYAKGIGMEEPDPIEAYIWYTLARPPLGQDATIEAALKALRIQLSKEQITAAEKRAVSYRKQFKIEDMATTINDFAK